MEYTKINCAFNACQPLKMALGVKKTKTLQAIDMLNIYFFLLFTVFIFAFNALFYARLPPHFTGV